VELRSLAAVVTVLEEGTYAAAARRSHLSQPALWAQVQALEQELGVKLFARSGRRVVPTAACLALRPRLQAALDDAEAIRAAAGAIRGGRTVPARVGCMHSHVSYFLAGCLRRLREEHPDAPMPQVLPSTSATVERDLTSGRVDFVVHTRLPQTDGFRLYPVELVAVGPACRGRRMDVRDLAGVPIATLPADSGARVVLERAAAAAGVTLQIVYEERDALALLALASTGLCTAVLVTEMLPDTHRDEAVALRSEHVDVSRDLWLQWRSEAGLSPAARLLRDVVRDEVTRRFPRSARRARR
jgi:DNA-binding transcriptional LysR family regulator